MLTLITLTLALFVFAAAANARVPLTVRISNTIVQTWTCETQLGVERTRAPSPWKPHSAGWRRERLNQWTLKRKACLAELHERARQYNWQSWLPAKWFRIARCETGVNWHHANSSYISAFGISRQAYDEDARAMGAAPWNDRVHPSPWEQYQAALGHYKLHGGFSGWGCRGA